MTEGGPITYSRQPLPDGMLLTVQGDVDFATSPELRNQLASLTHAGTRRLVVDLTGVSYMDSSGVATLVEALQGQRHGGGKLVLCGLQPRVQGIFDIARLNTVFTIAADAHAAKTV